MQYCQLKGIPNVGMNDIYTGNGVSELINLCMSALLDDGDEILIPAPDYPLWTATANLAVLCHVQRSVKITYDRRFSCGMDGIKR